MKRRTVCISIIIILIFMFVVLSRSCIKESEKESSQESNVQVNSEEKDIAVNEKLAEEREITNEKFELKDDIKNAIIQIALGYDEFDSSTINDDAWQEYFISKFIQNSRFTFSYLCDIESKSAGMISGNELTYIEKSLVGKANNYNQVVDASDSYSFLNWGEIKDYTVEINDDDISIMAYLCEHFDGSDIKKEYKLHVVLAENKESCFDGYTIKSVSKTEVINNEPIVDREKVFYGMLTEWDSRTADNCCTVEFSYAKGDIQYKHFVYIDLSRNDNLKGKMRNYSDGQELKITYSESTYKEDGYLLVYPDKIETVE